MRSHWKATHRSSKARFEDKTASPPVAEGLHDGQDKIRITRQGRFVTPSRIPVRCAVFRYETSFFDQLSKLLRAVLHPPPAPFSLRMSASHDLALSHDIACRAEGAQDERCKTS